jgi:hypothetical protein
MSQTAAGIEERATRVKEVRHDSSMIHDLQAPAQFLSPFRYTIMSAAIVPRLTASYMFPSLSGSGTLTSKLRIPKMESVFNRVLQA